ncbi:DUF7555 family protein [Halogeometricum limi]|uniref:Uncharacterized protein n=1 Tax=Halogeometricum limi TaxID=555875 RepID=A0A1I6FS25_9EURY|nr:hypothetical protein [Halogeometricum limi]SFR32714.1 hypothetical protein SAMN04488124_0172 [Halogeometricum limi]
MDLDSDTVDSRPRGDSGPTDEMPPPAQLFKIALDAATWGVVVLLCGSVLLALVGLVVGNGPVGFKRGLFVFGFLAMGGSLLSLRPKRAWRRGRDGASDEKERPAGGADGRRAGDAGEGRRSDVARRTLLPASLAPDPAYRSSWGLRVFVGGMWALFVSYLLETVFGVVPV